MLTTHRKQLLLTRLQQDGKLVAKELSQEFGVSEDTVRRDLREMAQEGLLLRVHGGALPASPAVADFAAREEIRHEGKVAIGRAAAAMIRAGQVVILDGGTTAREVARHIPRDLHATVVTHSPTIALELVPHLSIEVILLGGRLFRHSVVAVGAACLEGIAKIRADVFFMGVTGIHPQTGLTTGDYEEAGIKRALIGAAAETYVLASAEKLGAASPYKVTDLNGVTGIITEKTTDDALLHPYIASGLTLIRA
jgi:DeoR/GlpR family transcriptional regulator of sugar metabolism